MKQKFPYAKSLSKEDIQQYICDTISERYAHIITKQEYDVRMGKALAYAEAGWLTNQLTEAEALDFIITIENRIFNP